MKSKIARLKDILAIACFASGLAVAASYLGLFQNIELSTLDLWFRLRPSEPRESRVTVVTISEADLRHLQQWPISDRILSDLITKISQQQPRVIGLDLYRDLPIEPGVEELASVFRSDPNIIGVEKAIGNQVFPPPILAEKQQIALADLLVDDDGKVRRGLLSARVKNGEVKLGLAPRLALMYLAKEGIELKLVKNSSKRALGKTIITPLKSNDGGYIRTDKGGFQILLNYRGGENSFNQISILDILEQKIPVNLMKDQLVLVGSIAPSLNDLFPAPYSKTKSEYLPGVFIHANLASQILSEALEGRTSLNTISEPLEWLWIFGWTCGVGIFTWSILNHSFLLKRDIFSLLKSTTLCLILPETFLLGSGYLLFLSGWWVPVTTAGFALVFSSITISSYYNQNQKKLAYIDGLTLIPNRRYFDLFLEQQWLQNQKKKHNFALILCDIDYFKKYNDTYGHQDGDTCLKQVAQSIQTSLRSCDLAARYGGEEFAVVLPHADDRTATVIANRICAQIRSLKITHSSSEVSDHVSISCGVVSTSMGAITSIKELISIADAALYQAKQEGRDRPVLAIKAFE